MPGSLKGSVLTHSVAYNNFRNEYFVTWDVDQNNDNIPDRVYGWRINGLGQILDNHVTDFTLRMVSSRQNDIREFVWIDSKVSSISNFPCHFCDKYPIHHDLLHYRLLFDLGK